MKKNLAVMLLSAGLAGCGTTGALQLPTALQPPAIAADIAQVQSIAQGLCGWREPLNVLAQIVAGFTGGGATVTNANAIAAQICATVVAAPHGARRGAALRVAGVPLRGRFVR